MCNKLFVFKRVLKRKNVQNTYNDYMKQTTVKRLFYLLLYMQVRPMNCHVAEASGLHGLQNSVTASTGIMF